MTQQDGSSALRAQQFPRSQQVPRSQQFPGSQQGTGKPADPAKVAELFSAGAIEVGGQRYPYRLLEPERRQLVSDVPLLVFLHGAGERGSDNVRQLTWLPQLLAQADRRARTPCFLLALQCPEGEQWVDVPWGAGKPTAMARQPTRALRAVQIAMTRVLAMPGVDSARVYLTGLSMGGYGAWDLAARTPELFAGVAPVCGGGDPATVPRLLGLPMQIWHGAADRTVPALRSQLMVDQYESCGLFVQYREIAGVGHDVWRTAYREGNAIEWLFAQDQRQQRRGKFSQLAIVPRPNQQLSPEGHYRLRRGARLVTEQSLRRLTSYFLDVLEPDLAERPQLVGNAEPRAGDLSVRLEPDQAEAWQIDVGEVVRVTAQNPRAMRCALAVLYQAMQTASDHHVPYARLWPSGPIVDTTLTLAKPTVRWQRATLRQLLVACWLASVQTVCFEGGIEDHATPRAGREFSLLARRLGMQLVDRIEPPIGSQRTVSAVGGESIRKVFGKPGNASQGFVLLTPGTPADMLRKARLLLPAVLERASHRDGPLHVGGFLARLSARFR